MGCPPPARWQRASFQRENRAAGELLCETIGAAASTHSRSCWWLQYVGGLVASCCCAGTAQTNRANTPKRSRIAVLVETEIDQKRMRKSSSSSMPPLPHRHGGGRRIHPRCGAAEVAVTPRAGGRHSPLPRTGEPAALCPRRLGRRQRPPPPPPRPAAAAASWPARPLLSRR